MSRESLPCQGLALAHPGLGAGEAGVAGHRRGHQDGVPPVGGGDSSQAHQGLQCVLGEHADLWCGDAECCSFISFFSIIHIALRFFPAPRVEIIFCIPPICAHIN